jgi:polyvinyl alcohol dehydrogenase (cytochrome)
MTPEGYSGAAVWGSTPAVDTKRGAVYIATGNNYSLPDDAAACVDAADTREEKWACMEGNEFDAIVALDLKTGAIRWSFKALPSDAWNTDCGLPGFDETVGPNCPEGVGPDYDFGQGPMLFSATVGGRRMDLVGAGSKSGVFSTVNRDTGALVWDTAVGNGGLLGGLQWGSATDGERIYVAESNSTGLQRGAWSALDPGTGEILWETPDPGAGFPFPFFPGMYGYSAQGPVSVANGLVYGCSLSLEGPMVAMNAATGNIEWKRDSGTSCIGGASIGDGTVYWGTGYRSFAPVSSAGDRVFAFTPNGG